MSNLNRIIYLSDEQREELFQNNTITVDGVTINYNQDDLYVTPDDDGTIGTITEDNNGNISLGTSGLAPVITPLTVTQDGVYTAPSNVAYSPVIATNRFNCYATLSSAGWYRVLQTVDNAGELFSFEICRKAISNNNETHTIDYHMDYGGKNYFLNETSVSGNLYIDSIRYTYDNSHGYIDIHYNSSTASEVFVSFFATGCNDTNVNTVAMGLASVVDSPVGETVLKTYSFQDNTPNRRTYIGVIPANSSISVGFSTLATVKAARGSNSVTCVDAIADQWGGVSYSSRVDTFATVTSSGNVVTITNRTAGVMNYIIETY